MEQSTLFWQKLSALKVSITYLKIADCVKLGKTVTTVSFSEAYDFSNIISREQLQSFGVLWNNCFNKIALPNAWLGDNCEDYF